MATLTPLCSLQLGQGRRNHLEWMGLVHPNHELINVKKQDRRYSDPKACNG